MEWEYLIQNVDTTAHDTEGVVNALGRQGWELVAAIAPHNPTPTGRQATLFFKRPSQAPR